jgi:hypothetical protein
LTYYLLAIKSAGRRAGDARLAQFKAEEQTGTLSQRDNDLRVRGFWGDQLMPQDIHRVKKNFIDQ